MSTLLTEMPAICLDGPCQPGGCHARDAAAATEAGLAGLTCDEELVAINVAALCGRGTEGNTVNDQTM